MMIGETDPFSFFFNQAAEVASAVQFKGPILPIQQVAAGPEARAITAEEKAGNAYMKLRYARSAKRTLGAREKRARDKAEEEANKVRQKKVVMTGLWNQLLTSLFSFFLIKFYTYLVLVLFKHYFNLLNLLKFFLSYQTTLLL